MDSIEKEIINKSIINLLSTYAGEIPIISFNKEYIGQKKVIYLDPLSLDLANQIEVIAKQIKRQDINKIIILLKNVVDSEDLITKVALLFEEEDVFLFGVIAFYMDRQAAIELHEMFPLKILCSEKTEKNKTLEKKL